MQAHDRTYRILVIEDNATDVKLIGDALNQYGVDHQLIVLEDGEKALRNLDDISPSSLPDLIVLDINIPKHDGLEVLVRYRMNVALYQVPIVILTSSDAPSDKRRASIIGVNAFMRKPLMLEEFLALGEQLKAILHTPGRQTGSLP